MSLSISFTPLDKDFTEKEPNAGIFGFESWRKIVWGSSIIEELGCDLITTLKTTDIYAIGDNLIKLKSELILIKENVSKISEKIEIIDNESILIRVDNALEFINIVENSEEIDGIIIW